jgi:hypothetical protein
MGLFAFYPNTSALRVDAQAKLSHGAVKVIGEQTTRVDDICFLPSGLDWLTHNGTSAMTS